MKRKKQLTKREKKALDPRRTAAAPATQHQHIHCIACGRHVDPEEFEGPPASATFITCDHGSKFPSCVTCLVQAQMLVAAHDRNGQPVKVAQAFH